MFRLNMLLGLLAVASAGCNNQARILDPEKGLQSAWKSFQLQEYHQAEEQFTQIIERSEGDDCIEGMYGLATVYDLRYPNRDPLQASELYEEIIRLAPQSDYAAWSMLGLARSLHIVDVDEKPNYAAVQAAYTRVIERFPDHSAGEEAFLYQQTILLLELSPERGAQVAASTEAFIRKHPNSAYLAMAYSLWGHALSISGGSPASRMAISIKALEFAQLDPLNPKADLASAYWSLASTAEFAAGDLETARRYYLKLINEYPTDERNLGAKLALDRIDAIETEARRSASIRTAETDPTYLPTR